MMHVSIYKLTAGFPRIFCVFLNKEESYEYNFGRFRKCETGPTFLIFSIFGPYPKIVLGISILIQEKPAAEWIFPKFRFF